MKIEEYIKQNPNIGRRQLAKDFGISERVATSLKKSVLGDTKAESFAPKADLSEQLKKAITGKRKTIMELCDLFDCAPKTIYAAADELKSQHYIIADDSEGMMITNTLNEQKPNTIDITKHGEYEYVFGALGDTHNCSKYERLDVLNSIYDRFQQAGVTDAFLCGNWIDGESRFNKTDIKVFGLGNQVRYFVENYPQRDGIKTHVLSGDDHEGWYVQRENINIGQYMQMIAEKHGRTDLVDIGYIERDIELQRPNGKAVLRIIHAGGGSSYATSYTSQKYVESLQGGEKPQIVFVGHYHKAEYGYPREIHVLQVGCVEDQTPFMRKKKIQAHLGAWIVRIKQADNGIITSFNVEWMPYYDKRFYEYKW